MTRLQTNLGPLVNDYCRAHFARIVRPRLITDDLPWNLLPAVTHVRVPPGADISATDGIIIEDEMIQQALAVLITFVDFCIRHRIRLDIDNRLSYSDIVHMPRICIILKVIERQNLLELFLAEGLDDEHLPLGRERLRTLFSLRAEDEAVECFYSEQVRMFPRTWHGGDHLELGRREPAPLQHLGFLGNSTQSSVDEVALVSNGMRMARKRWSGLSQRAKRRFLDEVSLIKRLSPVYHIIEVFGTYERGDELAMLSMPVADCDLSYALSRPPAERQELIQDTELKRALGCLTVALAHVHESGVTHQDIKPQNILIHDGKFLLANFGVSKGIQKLSNSFRHHDQGTSGYSAPELIGTEAEALQSSADIFALGCVLLEIWSVLQGWDITSTISFSSLSPFNRNLNLCQVWIHGMTHGWIESCSDTCPFNVELDSPEEYIQDTIATYPDLEVANIDELDQSWLQLCSIMIYPDPAWRPTAKGILSRLISGAFDLYSCDTCHVLVESIELNESPAVTGASSLGRTSPAAELAHMMANTNLSGRAQRVKSGLFHDEASHRAPSAGIHHDVYLGKEAKWDTEPRRPHSQGRNGEGRQGHNFPGQVTNVIYFEDCLGRRFEVPPECWETWERMHYFIVENFPRRGYPDMREAIQTGQYDLIGPNGTVIAPGLWARTVRPGLEITLAFLPTGSPTSTRSSQSPQSPRRPPEDYMMSGALPVPVEEQSPPLPQRPPQAPRTTFISMSDIGSAEMPPPLPARPMPSSRERGRRALNPNLVWLAGGSSNSRSRR